MVTALGGHYHVPCFKCMTCHKKIDLSGEFLIGVDQKGQQQPFHRKCLPVGGGGGGGGGENCTVCCVPIPPQPDGSIQFAKHPFFESEKMCMKHATDTSATRCTSCHRFEPKTAPFVDLNDHGRCLCAACCRTALVDSNDATVKPIWLKVVSFMERLGLPVWDMKDIPILVVQTDTILASLRASSPHQQGSNQHARGLMLTDMNVAACPQNLKLQSLKFDSNSKSFRSESSGTFDIPQSTNTDGSYVNVNAILCAQGLPRDLAASVLAHEATHAWFRLNPETDLRSPLPPQVEEGCCQLISNLFLAHGLDPPPKLPAGEKGPTDEQLRQYYRFAIEAEPSPVYGDGYRLALKANNAVGTQALLNYVIRHKAFPKS
jgi:hypothetical protein